MNIASKILHSLAHNSLFSSQEKKKKKAYSLFTYSLQISVNGISQHLLHNMLLDVIFFRFVLHCVNFRSPHSHQTSFYLFVCLINKVKLTTASLSAELLFSSESDYISPCIPRGLQLQLCNPHLKRFMISHLCLPPPPILQTHRLCFPNHRAFPKRQTSKQLCGLSLKSPWRSEVGPLAIETLSSLTT